MLTVGVGAGRGRGKPRWGERTGGPPSGCERVGPRASADHLHIRASRFQGAGRVLLIPVMKRLVLCLALASTLLPAAARAQVAMQIQIGLPVAPPLVVVQPGVQVVEDYDEEVFFVDRWYWVRRGPHWYRARHPGAQFVYCEPQRIPYRLAYLPPPGHYRHWNRHQVREDRRWWREHQRERRDAWREHRRDYGRRRPDWRAERGPAPAPRPVAGPARPVPAPSPYAPGRGPGPAPGHGPDGHDRRGHHR
jgi:hypothetical protein